MLSFIKNNYLTIFTIIIVIAFACSVIPLFYISHFNSPASDDYSYGELTHKTYVSTGSVLKTIKTAMEQVKITYYEWQGTFSGIFMMAIQPAVFNENLYFLSTYLLLGTFIFANMFLLYQILVKIFKLNKLAYISYSLIFITLSIQFVLEPSSSFYWYNGSILYTFFYSISLILFGLIIRYIYCYNSKKEVAMIIPMCLIAIILGGSNYVTSLFTCVLTFCIGLYYILFDKKKKGIGILIIFLFVLAGLFISGTAPGNSVRSEIMYTSTPVMAVVNSIIAGLKSIVDPHSYIYTPMILPLTLIIQTILLKDIIFKKREYKYPLLVIIFVFLLYCSMYTPSYYTMAGPVRLINILFYAYIWIMSFGFAYILGFLYNVILKLIEPSQQQSFMEKFKRKVTDSTCFIHIICVVLLAFCVIQYNTQFTSKYAISSIKSGQAKQYHDEYLERVKILKSDEANVTLNPYSSKPYLLFFADIENPPSWKNRDMASYYEKESVTLK